MWCKESLAVQCRRLVHYLQPLNRQVWHLLALGDLSGSAMYTVLHQGLDYLIPVVALCSPVNVGKKCSRAQFETLEY